MSATALDTSVLVAGLLSWHESHASTLRALQGALRSGRGLVVPLPALLEAYAVMTRLPAPHRLAPRSAFELLAGSLESRSVVVGLIGSEAWTLLRTLSVEGIAGGRAYDAAILACAVKAGAKRLLTLDAADFGRLDPHGIEIVVPA